MSKFSFEFDKPDKKYKIGETVNVKVTIELSRKFRARSLWIGFKGDEEDYFDNYQYVLGSQYSREQTIHPGIYTYRVTYKLPDHLPFSIEQSNCYTYIIKANYDIPYGFDWDFSDEFYVTSLPVLPGPVNDIAPTAPTVTSEQPLPSYQDVTSNENIGWNLEMKSPSGALLLSTEKNYLDEDMPPPSFEESQKNPTVFPDYAITVASRDIKPSAPSDLTESATAPPE